MNTTVRCTTRFDITTTDVRGNFNRNRIPFVDATGKSIADESAWVRARNQQRNWETLTQVISLRTLPQNITASQKIQRNNQNWWSFDFVIEQPASIEFNGNPVGILYKDSQDVPMLLGLDEDADLDSVLMPGANIEFEIITHK